MRIKRVIALMCTVVMLLSTTFSAYAAEDSEKKEVVEAPYVVPDAGETVEEAIERSGEEEKADTDKEKEDEEKASDEQKEESNTEENKPENQQEDKGTVEEKETTETPEEEVVMKVSVQEAVKYGVEHSTLLQTVDNKVAMAATLVEITSNNIKDLDDAREQLDDASKLLKEKEAGLAQTESAYNTLDRGYAIADYTVQGTGIKISKGQNVKTTLMKAGLDDATASAYAAQILAGMKAQVEAMSGVAQDKVKESQVMINEAYTALALKEEEFSTVLDDTAEKVDAKINYSSIVDLDLDDTKDLMIMMAGVNLDVTKYAKGIYKNQVAMLIQKNYYDALYAKKVLDLKIVAEERGKLQNDLLVLSYEQGMKSKADYLLAKMNYDSTMLNRRLAAMEYENALLELKKNMNLSQDTKIELTGSLDEDIADVELETALETGLTNRVEIQQTLGTLMIYELNQEIINKDFRYKNNGTAKKEAKLLVEEAQVNLATAKQLVDTEIRQSYESVQATTDMMNMSAALVTDAKEVLEIAELKYEVGYGVDNKLLEGLDLSANSGTMVEVIASQEKLAEIEASVAQIRYNYIMARVKYYNDAGMQISK